MQFIYRFLDVNGIVIYVGIAKNINNRMKKHFSGDGHLPIECYSEVNKVQYVYKSNTLDIKCAEKHFIKLWKPKYNTVDSVGEESTRNFDDFIWVDYDLRQNFENRRNLGVVREVRELKKQLSIYQQVDIIGSERYLFEDILDSNKMGLFNLSVVINGVLEYNIWIENMTLTINDIVVDADNIQDSMVKMLLKNYTFVRCAKK